MQEYCLTVGGHADTLASLHTFQWYNQLYKCSSVHEGISMQYTFNNAVVQFDSCVFYCGSACTYMRVILMHMHANVHRRHERSFGTVLSFHRRKGAHQRSHTFLGGRFDHRPPVHVQVQCKAEAVLRPVPRVVLCCCHFLCATGLKDEGLFTDPI